MQIRCNYEVKVYTDAFDVSDDSHVRRFVDATHEHFGGIDVCVTNAGGPSAKPFAETTVAEKRHSAPPPGTTRGGCGCDRMACLGAGFVCHWPDHPRRWRRLPGNLKGLQADIE
jgi:NAD(P)-dependent dehydrogenase (short-subunit alcohol dehydrogenase family)